MYTDQVGEAASTIVALRIRYAIGSSVHLNPVSDVVLAVALQWVVQSES